MITEARERVARIAELRGEGQFAREVRAGCWDHRRDVQAALRGEPLRYEVQVKLEAHGQVMAALPSRGMTPRDLLDFGRIDQYQYDAWSAVQAICSKYRLTAESLRVFFMYAEDACNWSDTPLVGGNVGGTKEERGNLTQLKRAGLIATFQYEGEKWVEFTDTGRALAAEHHVEV